MVQVVAAERAMAMVNIALQVTNDILWVFIFLP